MDDFIEFKPSLQGIFDPRTLEDYRRIWEMLIDGYSPSQIFDHTRNVWWRTIVLEVDGHECCDRCRGRLDLETCPDCAMPLPPPVSILDRDLTPQELANVQKEVDRVRAKWATR